MTWEAAEAGFREQGAEGTPGGPRWALGRGGQAGWLGFKRLPLLPPVRPSCQLPLFPQNFPLGFLENFKSDATPGIWQPAHLQTLCQKKGFSGQQRWAAGTGRQGSASAPRFLARPGLVLTPRP